MQCEYFGVCGSCTLSDFNYEEQLQYKIEKEQNRFNNFYDNQIDIIKSDDGGFRNRVEFRIWKIFDENDNFTFSYAMNDKDKNIIPIKSCSIVSKDIADLMPKLLDFISKDEVLSHKLFSCEFLSSTIGDMLVTLIYHRKLDDNWKNIANSIEKEFNIKLIGRSRKQKIVLSKDFIDEELIINNKVYKYSYKEGGFTQPNQKVNIKMIEWVTQNLSKNGDLCELYCGGGNFTIPLSNYFTKVIATEISKTSIKSAKMNCKLNNIENIKFIRMSSEEFVEALDKKREFRRLELENINLDEYGFDTIFIDPPRAGLDDTTRKLVSKYNQIIYISCNPETLYTDLEILVKKHKIVKFGLFDQFAFSNHIECGVILTNI